MNFFFDLQMQRFSTCNGRSIEAGSGAFGRHQNEFSLDKELGKVQEARKEYGKGTSCKAFLQCSPCKPSKSILELTYIIKEKNGAVVLNYLLNDGRRKDHLFSIFFFQIAIESGHALADAFKHNLRSFQESSFAGFMLGNKSS